MEPAYRMLPADMRPPRDPFASWLGRVRVARPEEAWPEGAGGPLLPLCQVNVVELPDRPEPLRGVALVAVFGRDGDGEVRAYPTLSDLIPWTEVERASHPKPICWEATDDAQVAGDCLGGAPHGEGFVLRVAGFTVTRCGEEWRLVRADR